MLQRLKSLTTLMSRNTHEGQNLSLNPTETWELIKKSQVHRTVEPIPLNEPLKEGHLRFVCISDTHTLTNGLDLPKGDVLIHAGDFSNVGLPEDIDGFVNYLDTQDFKYKIIIAGNHDLTFDVESYPSTWKRFGHREMHDVSEVRSKLINHPNITYLEDSSITIEGISIYGSPWQPEFYGWAFNLPRGEPCEAVWKKIPDKTDVLITHGPPLGHGDLCSNNQRAGCYDLLVNIQQRIKPKYHIFGHIHEAHGITTDGVTTYINASICTLHYRPKQLPIIFDLPIPTSN